MNGDDKVQQVLMDHEVRITRLEGAIQGIFRHLERIEDELRELRQQMEVLRQEFHRDRRFSAMVFLTTQLAVIGALLRLAGVL